MATDGPAPALPVDLADFRRRSHAIWKAREEAREEAKSYGLAEAEAENGYQRKRALALARHHSEGASWTAAEKLSEGDASDEKLKRDTARVLKRSAEFRIEELERNASMLRAEATMSEGL